MGSSEVTFRGKQIEAPDPVLEVWLRLLVNRIDAMPEKPDWLARAREDWQLMATEELGFGIEPDLDGILVDPDRVRILRRLAEEALRQLEALGDPIPAAKLNALGAGRAGEGFPRDLPAPLFLGPARGFLALLGEEG